MCSTRSGKIISDRGPQPRFGDTADGGATLPQWNPNALVTQLTILPIFLMVFGFVLWLQSRHIQAKLDKRLNEAKASVTKSLQFQEESGARAEEAKARAVESVAMQRRGLEIAEESIRDRQEMLALLQRIAEILETRPRI
jgi:flagellar biosynthesis/type III secretory pathway M-ring protein FliF/YscJ